MERTCFNTELSEKNVGENVTLIGWVSKRRDLGSIMFIDLRDRSGIIQVTVNDATSVPDVRNEYVIQVVGVVRKKEHPNPNLKTGDIEVVAENINVINMTATMVKGGTFKVGAQINEAGRIEIYNVANVLIGTFDEHGICVYGTDGSRVIINPEEFAGYDSQNNKVFWMNGDEFHMKKSVIEEEITLCGLARWIGIETTDKLQEFFSGIVKLFYNDFCPPLIRRFQPLAKPSFVVTYQLLRSPDYTLS